MARWLTIGVLLSLGQGAFAQQETKSSKIVALGLPESQFYSSVEMRHHVNTYYDRTSGDVDYYETMVQGRAQLGATLHNNQIDAYATLGVIKIPGTQQVVQRRSELEVDIYPIRGPFGRVVQYNLVQLPFEDDDDYPGTAIEGPQAGSVYTIGLAPTAIYPTEWEGSRFKLKAGFDFWTKFYSRKQYSKADGRPRDRDYFGILSEQYSDEGDSEQPEVEDYAQHYFLQFMLGAQVKPWFASRLTTEAGVYHDSAFLPRYTQDDGETSYDYGAIRTTHYRLRLRYDLTERTTFMNDFYHFHDGVFSANLYGLNRRYRNVARLSYRL